MKKLILYSILQKARSAPKFKRKLKIFAAVSLVGVIFTGGFAIWASIAAFDYVARTAGTLVTDQNVESATAKISGKEPLLQPGCLAKATTMLNPAQWLERPLQQTFGEIRNACLVRQEAPRKEVLPAQRLFYSADQKENVNDSNHL